VLVFARTWVPSDRERVTLMNPDGSNPTGLAWGAHTSFLRSTHPVFSPDGKKIVFAAEEIFETDQSIWIMDADGANEKQLTHNVGIKDSQPSWRPSFPPDTTGVYVPSTGEWLLRNSNTAGDPDIIVRFGGQLGDLPAAGDWNGDGQTDLAIFRDGTFILARLDSIFDCLLCPSLVVADVVGSVSFGQAGDLPVAGDWNGDGKDDVGVFRPGPDQGTFLLRVPQEVQLCSVCPPHTVFITQTAVFGAAGQFPVAGDWLGKTRDGFGVFQPPATTMALASDVLALPDLVFSFGVEEGLPVAGHWTPLP
jgi:hypothetical protein